MTSWGSSQGLEEGARLAVPREHQLVARAGHGHVQEPALALDRVLAVLRVSERAQHPRARERVARAAEDQDRLELETLGAVHGPDRYGAGRHRLTVGEAMGADARVLQALDDRGTDRAAAGEQRHRLRGEAALEPARDLLDGSVELVLGALVAAKRRRGASEQTPRLVTALVAAYDSTTKADREAVAKLMEAGDMQAMRGNPAMAKVREARMKFTTDLKALLTADQVAKYDELYPQRMGRRPGGN